MCSADVYTSCLIVKEFTTRWLFFGIAPIQTAKKVRPVSSIVREKRFIQMKANHLETTLCRGYSRSNRTRHHRWMRRMMSLQYPSINFTPPKTPDRRMHARYSTVAFHAGDVEDISIPVVDDSFLLRARSHVLGDLGATDIGLVTIGHLSK